MFKNQKLKTHVYSSLNLYIIMEGRKHLGSKKQTLKNMFAYIIHNLFTKNSLAISAIDLHSFLYFASANNQACLHFLRTKQVIIRAGALRITKC